MDKVSELLRGSIDVHVHSGPGVIPRALDHFEAVQQCIEAGMRALVLKDQHGMTCNQAYFLQKYIFKDAPIHIFGGMTLNNATGGINVYAVDTAITYGAKIIWMPTLSAKNHIEWHKKEKSFFSQHERKDFPEVPLTILNGKGKLLPQVSHILRLIAKADIILGTGHLYLKEIKLLVDEALKQGVKKILMQHPEFVVNATIDDMIYFADKGLFIEPCYGGRISGRLTKDHFLEVIRKIGAERIVMSSDLGQLGRVHPVQGIRDCIGELLEAGITEEEIDFMHRKNPAKLLNLA